MDINYICTRKRKEFGRHCEFADVGPTLMVEIDSNKAQRDNFYMVPSSDNEIDNTTRKCAHEVNTISYPTENRGMNHTEGGWPLAVDTADEDSMARFRKKMEKDKNYINCVKSLADFVENFIMENNSIDIYDEYFDGDRISQDADFSLRNLCTFQDISDDYRSIVDLSWTRDSQKFAAAYALKQGKKYSPNPCIESYVWDAGNSVSPACILKPEVFITCVECSPTDVNLILSGYVSGQIALWDIRANKRAQQLSDVQKSHTRKITGLKWLVSKHEMAFFSSSLDGKLMSWDARYMNNPTETVQLNTNSEKIPNLDQNFTVSYLEYDTTLPAKFMAGTEQGIILSFNRIYKKESDMISAKYECSSGPLLTVERNTFFPQLFASCDSWYVKLWSDAITDSPILNIASSDGYFTSIAWSPTRSSTLYASKTTGVLEVWDIPGKYKDPLQKVKLANEALLEAAVSESGNHIACATLSGSVHLLKIPDFLKFCTDSEVQLVKDCVKGVDTIVGGSRRSERIGKQEVEPMKVAKDDDWDPPEKAEELLKENETLFKEFVTGNADEGADDSSATAEKRTDSEAGEDSSDVTRTNSMKQSSSKEELTDNDPEEESDSNKKEEESDSNKEEELDSNKKEEESDSNKEEEESDSNKKEETHSSDDDSTRKKETFGSKNNKKYASDSYDSDHEIDDSDKIRNSNNIPANNEDTVDSEDNEDTSSDADEEFDSDEFYFEEYN